MDNFQQRKEAFQKRLSLLGVSFRTLNSPGLLKAFVCFNDQQITISEDSADRFCLKIVEHSSCEECGLSTSICYLEEYAETLDKAIALLQEWAQREVEALKAGFLS